MKIGVLSTWDSNGREMGEMTLPNHRDYCRRHGYELVAGERPGYDFHWLKVLTYMLHVERFEWMFWIDTDAAFMNQATRIEKYIDESKDLVFCTDCHGINAGVLLWRCSDWTSWFFREMWDRRDVFKNHWNPEQTCMAHLLLKFPERWKVLPQREFNSDEHQYQSGDFVLHLGGHSNERRRIALTKFGVLPKSNGHAQCNFLDQQVGLRECETCKEKKTMLKVYSCQHPRQLGRQVTLLDCGKCQLPGRSFVKRA
jgi:hypothetical protein